MRIHSNGYVGIGTKAPTQKLDVDGKIRIRDGANNGYIAVSEPDGTMTWTDPLSITTLTGPTGPTGAQGIQGATGPAGQDGADGQDGHDGATGSKGAQGLYGATGTTATKESE